MTDDELRSLAGQIASATSFGADYFKTTSPAEVRTDVLNVMKAIDIADEGVSGVFDIEDGLRKLSYEEMARLLPMIVDAIDPERARRFIDRWNAGPLV